MIIKKIENDKKTIYITNSSNIYGYFYDEKNKTLSFIFKSKKIFRYSDVNSILFNKLKISISEGRFFYKEIKPFINKKFKETFISKIDKDLEKQIEYVRNINRIK
jgi:hypothetical protein